MDSNKKKSFFCQTFRKHFFSKLLTVLKKKTLKKMGFQSTILLQIQLQRYCYFWIAWVNFYSFTLTQRESNCQVIRINQMALQLIFTNPYDCKAIDLCYYISGLHICLIKKHMRKNNSIHRLLIWADIQTDLTSDLMNTTVSVRQPRLYWLC